MTSTTTTTTVTSTRATTAASLLLGLSLLGLAAGSAACRGDACEGLRARAAACGYAAAPYVRPEESICQRTLAAAAADIEALATCLDGASCDDTAALDACVTAGASADNACVHLALWASACGLEPRGTTDDCRDLRQSFGGLAFDRWVTCVTSGGCPTSSADERFARCESEVVPSTATELLDACALITTWNGACASRAVRLPLLDATDMLTCLSQAELFTAAAALAYGQCLSATTCDDLRAQLNCLGDLDILDDTAARASCQRLVDYGAGCGSAPFGDTVDACARIFARFTPESTEAFASCLVDRPCDDAAAVQLCGNLLVMP